MDLELKNASKTDTGLGTGGCGSVCIQIVSSDPKLHKVTTRSTCMNGGYISNKLDKPKAYAFPPFSLVGMMLAKAMRDKCTLNIITPVWPSQPRYIQLWGWVYKIEFPISNPIFKIPHFQIPWQTQTKTNNLFAYTICWPLRYEVSGNSFLQRVYQAKLFNHLKVDE